MSELLHGQICSRIWDSSDCLLWWSDLGLILWTAVVVWFNGLTWRTDWEDGLLWPLQIKNMRSRGNNSEKALNASESYVQRREEEIRKCVFFKFSCNWKLSCPGKVCKDSIKGCADNLFESFPFVLRIVNCNVRHHGNIPGSTAIFSLERSRMMQRHHIRWEKVWL